MFIPLKIVLIGIDPYPYVFPCLFPIFIAPKLPRAPSALPCRQVDTGRCDEVGVGHRFVENGIDLHRQKNQETCQPQAETELR